MRLFYGWVIVGTSFSITGLVYPSWHLFSVFYVAMLQEFGWSRADTAAAFSFFTIVYALSAVVAGRLVVRFGVQRVIRAGSVVLVAGIAATSLVQERWHLYLAYSVITAVGCAASGSIPNMTTVQNWFVRRRGLASGVSGAGIGVGMMVLAPTLQLIISTAGWRAAYLTLAVLTLLVIPLSFLHRRSPSDVGLYPDGDPAPPPRPAEARRAVAPEWTVGTAVRTGRYWLLFFGYVLGMFSVQLVLVHQVAALTDAGYDRLVAAAVVGAVGLFGSAAKIFWGSLSDRLGRELSMTLGGATLVGAQAVLALLPPGAPLGMLYLYVGLAALGYGVFSPLMPSMAADLFQGRHFAAIYGSLYMAHAVGSAGGPWLAGLLFDLLGSYRLPLALAMAAMAGACALFWLAGPRHARRLAQRVSGAGL